MWALYASVSLRKRIGGESGVGRTKPSGRLVHSFAMIAQSCSCSAVAVAIGVLKLNESGAPERLQE